MGRAVLAVTGDALVALSLLCATVVLAMPWVAARIAGNAAGPKAALLAFLLVWLHPLGPDLAFSLLSDGAGILFVLIFVALLPDNPQTSRTSRAALLAGIALGWALACRPSYLVLALAAGVGGTIAAPRSLWALWPGAGLVLGPVALGLLAIEPLYLVEGARFVEGHARIWGNTVLTDTLHQSWITTLLAHPFVLILLSVQTIAVISLLLRRSSWKRPALLALGFGFTGHALWTIWFQNPNSLRHLVPLLVLGAIVLAIRVDHRGILAGVILASVLCLAGETTLSPQARPPLLSAARHISTKDGSADALLITNRGVQLMRSILTEVQVYDAYYSGDAALGAALATGDVWRLSGTPPKSTDNVVVLTGRFLGEPSLYLFAVGKDYPH